MQALKVAGRVIERVLYALACCVLIAGTVLTVFS
jgi:hypothetical protein